MSSKGRPPDVADRVGSNPADSPWPLPVLSKTLSARHLGTRGLHCDHVWQHMITIQGMGNPIDPVMCATLAGLLSSAGSGGGCTRASPVPKPARKVLTASAQALRCCRSRSEVPVPDVAIQGTGAVLRR